MKPESRLSGNINKKLPPEIHREKMHNPYRGGTADFWYSAKKADMWIEWKWIPARPKRPTTLILPDLSALQVLWLRGRYAEGRRVSVVVGSPDGCLVFRTPDEWEKGLPNEGWITRDEVAKWMHYTLLG